MKFLLWQFAAYAGAAMALGIALGIVWATSTRRALTRHLERVERTLDATEQQLRRVREQRSRDEVALRESRELSNKLVELHASLALVEADVRANQIGRVEAERMRDEAVLAADRYRAEAAAARQNEFELARVREKLAEAHASLDSLRSAATRAVGDAEARAARLAGELAALRRAHDAQVIAHQRQLSEALVDAEQAYAHSVTLEAQLVRLETLRAAEGANVRTPVDDDRVIDLRQLHNGSAHDAGAAAGDVPSAVASSAVDATPADAAASDAATSTASAAEAAR